MKAYWLQMPTYRLDSKMLTVHGIECACIDPFKAEEFKASLINSYPSYDEVTVPINEVPKNLLPFWHEHCHADDEVRYVTAGNGVFDIRGRYDHWIRIEVGVGDAIKIPAGRWHRFSPALNIGISAIRYFGKEPKWEAEYRHAAASQEVGEAQARWVSDLLPPQISVVDITG